MTQATKAASRPAAVYRLYAADGTLLYIGSAYDPEKRCKRHRNKPWWPLVARREDEWCEGRSPAYRAEMKAIAAEGPSFNDFGTPRYRTPQTPAVLKRAETMLACGRAQRLAWKAWRKVRDEALADGVPRDGAWHAAEKARYAVIEASGLFPHWIERRKEHGTL